MELKHDFLVYSRLLLTRITCASPPRTTSGGARENLGGTLHHHAPPCYASVWLYCWPICVAGAKKRSFSYNYINFRLSNDAKLNMYSLA